jgi:hypothetical protein
MKLMLTAAEEKSRVETAALVLKHWNDGKKISLIIEMAPILHREIN